MNKSRKETLAGIGEFAMIERIAREVGETGPPGAIGIGDDAALFRPSEGRELLVTCDVQVEGEHFDPTHFSPVEIGARAAAVAASDIAAMGGEPFLALVSLGLHETVEAAFVEEIIKALKGTLAPMGAWIAGGNLSRTPGPLFIDVTLIGSVTPGHAVPRDKARPGDLVMVTGRPGSSAAGLALLRQEGKEGRRPWREVLIGRYKSPVPRIQEGRLLADEELVTSMIDLSDGLAGDLGHLCRSSGVGAEIDIETLLTGGEVEEAAQELGREAHEIILGPSDDYELLFTCQPTRRREVEALFGTPGRPLLSCIGRILKDTIIKVCGLGKGCLTQFAGWDHFSKSERQPVEPVVADGGSNENEA